MSREDVERVVCRKYGCQPEDLTKKTRKGEICESRQLCAVILYWTTRYSRGEVARSYGLKSHATIIHAQKKLNNLYQTDKHFRMLYDDVQSELSLIPNLLQLSRHDRN